MKGVHVDYDENILLLYRWEDRRTSDSDTDEASARVPASSSSLSIMAIARRRFFGGT